MASIGDLLLNIMGNQDPMKELQQRAGVAPAPTSATPAAAGPTPSAVAGGPGMAAPAGPAPAPAAPPKSDLYESPEELMGLYMRMMERNRRSDSITAGAGMVASAFSDNPSALIAATSGDSSGRNSQAGDMLTQLMTMQTNRKALETKAAQRAALPEIAKKYGLDMATASYLFDSGELDAVIKEAEKPNRQLADMGDGRKALVDLTDGRVVGTIGQVKPDEIEIKTDQQGNMFGVNKKTGQRVGENIANGTGATADQQNLAAANADRAAAGKPPMTMEEWVALEGNKRGTTVNVGSDNSKGQTKVDETYAPDFIAWTQGGRADAQKSLAQMREAGTFLDDVANGKIETNLSGPVIGNIPDRVKAFTEEGQKSISVREAIEEVVQRNLRLVLGAQFTQEEGERLIKRAFNPLLDEKENAKRLRRLLGSVEEMAKQKDSASEYFSKNGTLTGWGGAVPRQGSMDAIDLGDIPDAKGDKASTAVSDDDLVKKWAK